MTAPDPLLRLTGPPVDGVVLSTTEPQNLVAVAHDAAALTKFHVFLRGLSLAGHSILLMWSVGTPGPELDFLTRRHPLRRDPADRRSVVEAIEADRRAKRALKKADGVLGFGQRAREGLEQIARGRTRAVPHEDLTDWTALARTWPQLRARAEAGRLTPSYARHLARLTALLADPVAPLDVQAMLTDLLAELERSGNNADAVPLLPCLRSDDPDPVEQARRRAVTAQVRTSAFGAEDPDLRPSTSALLAAADEVLARGDTARAAALTTVCLGSLFHAELHADGLSTPLVTEPDDFLGAWRASRIGRLLGGPAPRGRREGRATEAPPAEREHTRVLVAPGSYPRFAQLVTADLRARPDVTVDVLDWADHPHATGLGVRGELVEMRLRQAIGEPVHDPALVDRFAGVDAAFVDWADRGAVLALMHLPAEARVTLRIHSMDALSAWVQLIDWSAVDDLVLVSDHLRDLVLAVVGRERLAATRIHVVDNAVDLSRIPQDKTAGHLRRLLMVGWAPRVKDVEWALEVLDSLRADDDTWTLTLVGADLPSRRAVPSSIEYTTRVQERLAAAVQQGAVEVVAETPDLAPYWRAAGFALNTSRRESFALALVEAVVARCVPVVRNWPVFAPLDGARRLFPAEWVVDTVPEAVARILAHADEGGWQAEADTAGDWVAERFLAADHAARLGDIVLGPPAGRTPETPGGAPAAP